VHSERPVNRLRVDLVAECIWRDGNRYSVPPKAFRVLRCLMERPEELVTKETLLDAVWPETYVIDKVLNIAVSELRQALGDDPKQPRFIATVHRRGFRWTGPPAATLASAADEDAGIFVGRSDGLAELERGYAHAAAGQRQMVFVTGEAGIGKSTLVDRFLAGLAHGAAAPASIAYGQCVDRYGVGEVYRPLLDAAETMLRAGGPAMVATFRKYAPSWLLRMADVLDAKALAALQRTATDVSVERMQRELGRALEAIAAEQVVVLALEDLHWSDVATTGFLGTLAAGRRPARLLIIGTYRPFDAVAHQHPIMTLKRELAGKRQCSELPLSGLSSEAVDVLLAERFGAHRLPAPLAPRLQAQTSGNPLFLLNALADLVQRGWLYEDDGAWQCGADLDALAGAVPGGTRELIAMRLDLLPPATQELLEAASVAGVSFTTQALAAALERSEVEIEAECDRLTHTLFLQRGEEIEWPDGSRGRQQKFRHILYRHVLEERIPPSRRKELHQRIAARMDRGYGARAGEIAATLRFHYEQAGELSRAVDCIDLLVQQCFARRAMHEAMALYEDAIQLLERLPPSEATARRLQQTKVNLGFLSTTTVGHVDAWSASAVTAGVAAPAPTSLDNFMSLGGAAATQIAAGDYQQGLETADAILALDDENAPGARLTGHALAGMVHYHRGDIRGALEHLDLVATLANATPIRAGHGPTASAYDAATPALGVRAQALVLAGHAAPAAAAIELALARAGTLEMPWYLSWALNCACNVAVMGRDPTLVRQRANQLETHCGDGQDSFRLGARFMLAWAAVMESGDPASTHVFRERLDEYGSIPNPLITARNFSMLAEAHLRVGQPDGAAAALDCADAARGQAGYYDAERRRQRAAVALARGRRGGRRAMQDAETALEDAIALAVAQGASLFALRATVDRAHLWHGTERSDDARQRLTQALAALDVATDAADARDARALLDTL
jgi:DNA-binding winged helix-turn-helix (wHTH) protein